MAYVISDDCIACGTCIDEVTAWTRIHGGNQLKVCWELVVDPISGDIDRSIFQWLSECFDTFCFKFHKFVQK